jgi:hypothetical protein
MQISLVPPEYGVQVWPKVRGYIARAVEHSGGRFTPEDVLESVVDGTYQLWIAFEGQDVVGVTATFFTEYPRCKVLTVTFTGGERLREWSHLMLNTLRAWGKDHGCDRIESVGRPGWAKIFQTEGHKLLWHTFEIPLETPAAHAPELELEMTDGR